MKNTTILSKKIAIFMAITTLVLSVATQVSAKDNEKENENHGNLHYKESASINNQIKTSNNYALTENCEEHEKNHGDYVSCVAKLHLGGKEVSEEARSGIGKKAHEDRDNDDDDFIRITITPTVAPSTTPSVTPSETPSITPSETPSETPTATPTATINGDLQVTFKDQIQGLIDALRNLFLKITHFD